LALVYRKTIEEHRGMQKRVLHEPIKCLKMLLVQQVIAIIIVLWLDLVQALNI